MVEIILESELHSRAFAQPQLTQERSAKGSTETLKIVSESLVVFEFDDVVMMDEDAVATDLLQDLAQSTLFPCETHEP
jgi:hypothetical protein